MSRIEQNDFLYTMLTNPDAFLSDEKMFEHHPLTKQSDPSIIKIAECQYITVEGAQYGDIYFSENYLMFKSRPERIGAEHKFAFKVTFAFLRPF